MHGYSLMACRRCLIISLTFVSLVVLLLYPRNRSAVLLPSEANSIRMIEGVAVERSNKMLSSCDIERPQFDFSVRPPFSLPDPNCRPVEQVLSSEWVCHLQNILNSVSPSKKLINVIVSDSNYQEVVLNWLIAALVKNKEPLINVLVISMDNNLHRILSQRKIPSILVDPSSVVYGTPADYIQKYPLKMTRLTVIRLISHWGFDVANYDPDAVVLKNPELFYDQAPTAHIIGGFGVHPSYQSHIWGASLCIGSWLIRSSNVTGIAIIMLKIQALYCFIQRRIFLGDTECCSHEGLGRQ